MLENFPESNSPVVEMQARILAGGFSKPPALI